MDVYVHHTIQLFHNVEIFLFIFSLKIFLFIFSSKNSLLNNTCQLNFKLTLFSRNKRINFLNVELYFLVKCQKKCNLKTEAFLRIVLKLESHGLNFSYQWRQPPEKYNFSALHLEILAHVHSTCLNMLEEKSWACHPAMNYVTCTNVRNISLLSASVWTQTEVSDPSKYT